MTVLKDRKKTYVDHSKEFKTVDGKSLSRMKEMGFFSKRCARSHYYLRTSTIERHFPHVMARKMQNGSGMFSGQMNQDFVFLVMLPNAAFEDPNKDFFPIA